MSATSHFRGFFRPALGALCMLWALAGCAAEGNQATGTSEAEAMAAEPAPLLNTYWKLVQMGDMLIGLIRRSRGRDNKTLAAFAEAISKIISKFEF